MDKKSSQISDLKQEVTDKASNRPGWKKLDSIGTILILVCFFQLLVDPFGIGRTRVGAGFTLGALVLGLAFWAYSIALRVRIPSKEKNKDVSRQRESTLSHFLMGLGGLVFAFVLFLVIKHQLQTGTRGGLITFELLFVGGGVITALIEWTRAVIQLVKNIKA